MTQLLPESLARSIMVLAIATERCSETLECLFDGGTATVDRATGKLVLIPGDVLRAWEDDSDAL